MKAALLHEIGGIPRYEDFPDPVAGDDEVVIDVKAAATTTNCVRYKPLAPIR